MTEKKLIEVVAAVIEYDGRILCVQRGPAKYSYISKKWEFPGGKIELDESHEKALLREIKEELGIIIQVGEKLLSFEHAYTHKKLYFTVHICELKSGEPRTFASQKLLWVSPEKLFDFPFPAANTRIISELFRHLGIENKKL